jgi:hypothetical protein
MKKLLLVLFTTCFVFGIGAIYPATDLTVEAAQKKRVTIRTETFPRPPYSGATYYIYEREGETICTKLEVCNKFGNCTSTYKNGTFKEEDIETGDPYGKTNPVVIAQSKLKKHACLTKFKLLQ